jgi:5'-nucleotidase
MDKPLILVVNDDGITAKGIRCLVESVADMGRIIVVAPDKPQSAMGHAITINQPLRLTKVNIFGDIEAYTCSGTPVDCVKLAIDKVLHRKPDLCLSGINHGSNASINVIYSGTMSAAMEASLDKIPAVGFSSMGYGEDTDMSAAQIYVRKIVHVVLQKGIPGFQLLNVNIPVLPYEQIKGIKVCHQAKAKWEENYEERRDPQGRRYYWLSGNFEEEQHEENSDLWALKNNYVSVVPVQHDLTDYNSLPVLKQDYELNS